MIDEDRVLRLLHQIDRDVTFLDRFAGEGRDALLADEVALAAVKYRFVTLFEGCTKVAHHLAAVQGWGASETNADAVRQLGSQGVLPVPLAEVVATGVGFRNVLVHQYGDVDDRIVVSHLDELGDLRDFTAAVARWLYPEPGDPAG